MPLQEQIIEGCLKADPKCQEELYLHCYPSMIKICSRYARDADEAGALYNEAMLKIFSNIRQFKGETVLEAWVRKIVVNTCIDHCRKQAKFDYQPVNEIIERSVTIHPDIYNRLAAADVMLLIKELPGNTALVFNLYVMEGYKHEEVACILGIATGTSKWHLNEARRLLKSKLDALLKKEIYHNAI